MTSKNFQKKSNAKAFAMKRRKMGLTSTLFKKKKGYGVSTTRKQVLKMGKKLTHTQQLKLAGYLGKKHKAISLGLISRKKAQEDIKKYKKVYL